MIAVGDELLAGDTINTNAAFVGRRCRALGVALRHVATVRDRVDEVAAAVEVAARRSDVCFISGGLGPTTDDLTTEAVAIAAGIALRRDLEAVARLEEKWRAFGRPMPPANLKQCDFPEGAAILSNPIGSAEGFTIDLHGCRVFVMPGVPRELHMMMEREVEPWVRERFGVRASMRRLYRVLGRGESSVAESVEPIVAAARSRSQGLASVFVHYRAAMPEVTVGIEALPGLDGAAATEAELRSLDAALLDALAPSVYGIGEAGLPPRVIDAMRRAGLRLATAESCTGGGVGKLIASVAGASDVFVGGVVSYANAVKESLLHVPAPLLAEHGAVSEPVARAMAAGAREATGADLSVAVTGIAGPSGGSPEKPVGTVHIAVSDAEGVDHVRLQLRGDRGTVQKAAELWALKLVWDRLHARGVAQIEETSP
jgi:nicotinamide-nucleotide amidase